MAFKRESRLRKSSLISFVYKKGDVFKTSFFRVKYLKSKFLKTQITIIISKKTEPLAVLRNKIRRKLSASIHNNIELLKFPILLVFFPNRNILFSKNNDLQKSTSVVIKKMQEKILYKKNGL
jgi:ribonuclease P protein component